MSTEHQRYSTENQGSAIRQYVARRGIEIVRTYADEGKSGLGLDGRNALKQLIDDVQGGTADFEAILVYDISRWGRFQDADESAYYEYICKRAGQITLPDGRRPAWADGVSESAACHHAEAEGVVEAQSWKKPRRIVAKVEWHPGELYLRVGFIVTNTTRRTERVVAFYNQRGTCEQWIKEGKGAIKWTRLSCRSFAANAVRLQLHALAYNLGNFMRTLAMPETAEPWSLTSLREKLIKIGAKVVSHGRYVTFQMAEIAVPQQMFADILSLIARLRAPPAPA